MFVRLVLAAVGLTLASALGVVASGTAEQSNTGAAASAPGQQRAQSNSQGAGQGQSSGGQGQAQGGGQGQAQANSGGEGQAQGQAKGNSEGTGANQSGPYNPSGVGKQSGNGNSDNNNGKRPCAGCVGKADAKNPPGQLPGGSDRNRGYECDENQGVGKTNPAHSGCGNNPGGPEGGPSGGPSGGGPSGGPGPQAPAGPGPSPSQGGVLGETVTSDRATSPEGPVSTPARPNEGRARKSPSEKALPFSGSETLSLALLGAIALLGGLGTDLILRRRFPA